MEAREYLIGRFKEEGLEVSIDTVGNIIAKRKGKMTGLPSISMGSHIDTVYEGGKYDGTIGVAGALEIIQYFNDNDIQTNHSLEIIVFSAEESSRFGASTLGSGFMTGSIKDTDVKQLKDRNGYTLNDIFLENGMDLGDYHKSLRQSDELKAFIELHIEQGPVLEEENLEIGIVEAIAAPIRLKVTFKGEASHSGTTPIRYRKDALVAASELVLYVEEVAKEEAEYGSVATVGVMDVKPGGMNIVPGTVDMDIDIRSVSDSSKARIYDAIKKKIGSISRQRFLDYDIEILTDKESVHLSAGLTKRIQDICEQKNILYKFMNSGAGHDAMNMATLWPTALIFVPSRKGVSHNPEEFTEIEDIYNGLTVMKELILSIDEEVDENESQ